jgi:hypothetical protein
MLRDVIEVRPIEKYELLVRFDDGAQGVVGVSRLVRLEGSSNRFAGAVFSRRFGSIRSSSSAGRTVRISIPKSSTRM